VARQRVRTPAGRVGVGVFSRRLGSLGAALAVATLLAACSGGSSSNQTSASLAPPGGGGSSGGSGGGSSPAGSSDWNTRSVAFDVVLAQQIANSAEFRAADADCVYVDCLESGAPGPANQSSAYELHKVHLAHSAGLTGAGQIVAVVDNGFGTSHQEFDGKALYKTGTLPVADHGTHVASLIAGVKDGVGMHGVAPEADLHLTSFSPSGTGFDLANVTAGTKAAASLGAVAQNNSWGFDKSASELQNYLATNPGATTAHGLNALVGHGSTAWQNQINALDDFQKGGVVVWALSNERDMTSGDILAALPYFETRLSEAWIAAANGYFEVDGDGDITKAVRLSAACGYAARFCLAGDGTTTAAQVYPKDAYGDDKDCTTINGDLYCSGTGTSFVAPQIAASVALLAEAFPDLTPAEWAKRLLASADNSWFAALGVGVSGTVDFGNGVTHAYSSEWGHGVLDLEAALSPIGTVSVLSGEAVTTSPRLEMEDSAVVTPRGFGDSLVTALAGEQLAVFDALNRSFSVSPGVMIQPGQVTLMPRLMAAVTQPEDARTSAPGLDVTYTQDLGDAAAGFTGIGGSASVLSMAGEAMLVSATGEVGAAAFSAYGFAGGHGMVESGNFAGGGVTLTMPAGLGTASVGVGLAAEQGGVMGLAGNSAFDFGDASTLATVNLGIEQQLAPSLGVFGRLEYGAASTSTPATRSLVASVDGIRFSGIEIGAVLSNVVTGNDRLTVSIAQPMRIESGNMAFELPVARTASGAIVRETAEVELQSSGREVDLGLDYAVTLDNGASLNLGMQYAIDAGHIAGASAFGAAVGFRQGF
jgi:subtilase-type serine protease